MNCLHDGILRARLDGELAGAELAEVNTHLASCTDCRAELEKLMSETALTQDLLATLAPAGGNTTVNPTISYARFNRQFGTAEARKPSWTAWLFTPRWRPVWGLTAAAMAIAILVGVGPARVLAQKVLAMLRVQRIAVVTIDPATLRTGGESDSQPYKLIDQFFADNVVVTLNPGKPETVATAALAAQLAGYPIRVIGNLGVPQSVRVSGETAFQMTVNRDRVEGLLGEIGRSDIQIPASADGALIAVHIPKIAISMYGVCASPQNPNSQPHDNSEPANANCTALVQVPSPTVSVPQDLNMSEIAEAALELAGMTSSEAHSFCQTVDWSSTLVIPIPRNSSSYETVTVDGVEGTLIMESSAQGNRYSLLWVKNGMIYSLAGSGSSSDALGLAASLQ